MAVGQSAGSSSVVSVFARTVVAMELSLRMTDFTDSVIVGISISKGILHRVANILASTDEYDISLTAVGGADYSQNKF